MPVPRRPDIRQPTGDQPTGGEPREGRLSRREVLRAGALGGAALTLRAATAPAAQAKAGANRPNPSTPIPTTTYDFNGGWRFAGYRGGSQDPEYSPASFSHVNLPHTVVPLSWGEWSPSAWEQLWIYRKQFSADALLSGGRALLDFDGVMTDATVYLNGTEVGQHQGGFLPFTVELTDALSAGENDLGVVVDGRWLQVPPAGNASGPPSIDYFLPAGIHRDVRLRYVPQTFISDVFAAPADVLSKPRLDVLATIDAGRAPHGKHTLTVELLDGRRVVAHHSTKIHLQKGISTAALTLDGLHGLTLWSPDTPKLYTVRTTLSGPEIQTHTVEVRTGFRDATFTPEGLYLNGKRLQIFGLGHHALFPYTGFGASQRLQARDAELMRNVLNCNMVRCSHYPQSPHFLDACDEVGLMVWEEPPGWQYMGDAHFQSLVLQNVRDMVVRDRNRPSVIVWATRLDETASNYDELYAECRALAYRYDGTRPTTGAMDIQNTANWSEDVYAYNDYHTSNGNAILEPPLTGLPYMISEAVGALDGPPTYRWIDPSQTLQTQARMHAQVQDIAYSNPVYSGVLAWCAVDYQSLQGGNRNWQNAKWCGVLDMFRVPKPGASFYRSQQPPSVAPVILPAFYWDFGPDSPATGPGEGAMICTNCEELQILLDGQPLTTGTPDTASYGSLPYPPVFVDLTVDGSTQPTLQINGYIGGALVTSLQMSSNPATDRLSIDLEDPEISGDGTDTTRLVFRALDAFGNQRPYVSGNVTVHVEGPVTLVGQNPFAFAEYGGVGGVILRSDRGRSGTAAITVTHPTLGTQSASLRVTAAKGPAL